MQNRKKVLFVIPNLDKGGAERVVSILLRHLDREKIIPVCVFYYTKHVYDIPEDVRTYTLETPGARGLMKKIGRSVQRIGHMLKIYRKESPDVICSFLTNVNLLIVLINIISMTSRRAGIIISERTTPSLKPAERFEFVFNNLKKILYPKADRIIANSEGVKKDLILNYGIPADKVSVIYNPVDIDMIDTLSHEEICEHSWFDDDIPILINVGSLVEPKAQEYLIKALCVVRQHIECRLVFLGEGKRKKELCMVAKSHGVRDDILFLGFQKNPFKFLKKSTVFVLSSRREGFPNALLEAMACGVPVISTRCRSGPEEIITDGVDGVLVPVEDHVRMAEAILGLLKDNCKRNSLVANARKTILRYDVSKTIAHYENLFMSGGN
jgi:glycosyltransferase involved in cell wall biosynthesis